MVFAVLGIGVNVNLGRGRAARGAARDRDQPRESRAESPSTAPQLQRKSCSRNSSASSTSLRAGAFAAVLERFRKSFRMPGAKVRIGGPGVAREVIGTVLGVDEEGALLLRPLEGGAELRRTRAGGRRDVSRGARARSDRLRAARDRHRQHQRRARACSTADAASLHHWRIGTHREDTSDECAATRALAVRAGRARARLGDRRRSSRASSLRCCRSSSARARSCFGRPPLVVGPGIRTGMPIRVENPREVGADRIVNAVADARAASARPRSRSTSAPPPPSTACRARASSSAARSSRACSCRWRRWSTARRSSRRVEILRPPNVIGRNTTQIAAVGHAVRLRRDGRLDGRAHPQGAGRGRPGDRHRRPRRTDRERDRDDRTRGALPDPGRAPPHLRAEPRPSPRAHARRSRP